MIATCKWEFLLYKHERDSVQSLVHFQRQICRKTSRAAGFFSILPLFSIVCLSVEVLRYGILISDNASHGPCFVVTLFCVQFDFCINVDSLAIWYPCYLTEDSQEKHTSRKNWPICERPWVSFKCSCSELHRKNWWWMPGTEIMLQGLNH